MNPPDYNPNPSLIQIKGHKQRQIPCFHYIFNKSFFSHKNWKCDMWTILVSLQPLRQPNVFCNHCSRLHLLLRRFAPPCRTQPARFFSLYAENGRPRRVWLFQSALWQSWTGQLCSFLRAEASLKATPSMNVTSVPLLFDRKPMSAQMSACCRAFTWFIILLVLLGDIFLMGVIFYRQSWGHVERPPPVKGFVLQWMDAAGIVWTGLFPRMMACH